MRQLGPTQLKRLHRSWHRITERRLALLLAGVQSPWNLGGIIRTAAALRVDDVYLTAGSLSPSHPGAAKTAMGTQRYLQWQSFSSHADAMAAPREAGYLLVGVELADGAVPLPELELAEDADVCLVIGHEDHGIPPACLEACDAVAYIPLLGRVGSLNVATAAAIAMYEVRRREWVARVRT
jgi:tRNA (guanosine-2'-O-)-methyltransferase